MSEPGFSDSELLYAATARCRCGAGLAYPTDQKDALQLRAWVCSRVLRGEVSNVKRAIPLVAQEPHTDHDVFDWAFFKVREETSVNNHGGHTTRPPGTSMRTVGYATCPKCEHEWTSEPYSAPLQGHHWESGPCPKCEYGVGADGSCDSRDGKPIDVRFRDTVFVAAPEGSVSK